MIFTFYSYKGGVGRSMALAEVAARLARRNLKVLAIDFDLEAPGLERYFFDTERSKSARAHRGLLDLIQTYRHALTSEDAFKRAEFHDLDRFRLRAIHVAGRRGGFVDLMTAGRREPAESMTEYAVTVRGFDWQDFFHNWRGDLFFEWLRGQLTRQPSGYDVVLVDSRTGVTEMGGVCAYQLADVVVLLCAPNYQNLEGTRDVVRDFLSPGVMGLRRGRSLEILAIPARVDENHPKRDEFLAAFARELGVDGMPKRLADARLDYAKLALPYLGKYAVTEIQVGTRGRESDDGANDVFERLTDALTLLAPSDTALGQLRGEALDRLHGTAARTDTGLVADSSRESAGFDCFIDAGPRDRKTAAELRDALERIGLRAFDPWARGEQIADEAVITALEYSRTLLVCFGGDSHTPWREQLLARARRLEDVQIVSVVFPGGQHSALRSYGLDENQEVRLALRPADDRSGVALLGRLLQTHSKRATRARDTEERDPYPGARPYTENEARFFAGRETEARRLSEAVAASDVVFVSGPAQIGKTSLLKAGLLPQLRQASSEESPGARLGNVAWLDYGADANPAWPGWMQALTGRQQAAAASVHAPHLVVIDAADTFSLNGSEPAIQQRVNEIISTVRLAGPACKVIVVWRDTLVDPHRQALLDAGSGLKVAHVAVDPLSGDALRHAIEQPALRAGHLLEPGLADRLMESAGNARSAILQLQLALAAIWPRRQRGWVTNKHLDDAGHLGGVFQQHIATVLGNLTEDQRRAAEAMFKSLAMLDTTLKLVPLAQFWSALASIPRVREVDAVALRDRLADAGLIDLGRATVGERADGRGVDTDVQLALVRPNAMAYFGGGEVIPDVRFLMWRRSQFAADVERWQRGKQTNDLVLDGSRLSEAEGWLELRRDELSEAERTFIEASITFRERQTAPEIDDHVGKSLQERGQEELRNTTHSVLTAQVDEAMSRGDFASAKALLRAMYALVQKEAPDRPADPYLVQRLALATYKSKQPSELAALNEALALLATLEPHTSNDTETLGLWAAVHKRLWNLTEDQASLDSAVRAYDRGFYLRNDYYNGINLAFVLNVRAGRTHDTAEAVTDFILAERVRKEVLSICEQWLAAHPEEGVTNSDERYWVLATIAEAMVGLGDERAQRTLDALYSTAPSAWMADSTKEQITRLQALLADSPLKHLSATT